MVEVELYQSALLVAGIFNIAMAFTLCHNNFLYHNFKVYQRACFFTAMCFLVFGIGFFLHYTFVLRTVWPAGATALSVSYFHIGGMMVSWSHTSLLNPSYLTRRVVVRDIAIAVIGLIAYWTTAYYCSLPIFHLSLLIFLLHVTWLAFKFYHTYYTVSHSMTENNLYEQTDGKQKFTLFTYHRSFLLSCHLIIGFGIGSIILTAFNPTAVWPYTLLLSIGIVVFIYIFYSLCEYGIVIDSATNALDEMTLFGRKKAKAKI